MSNSPMVQPPRTRTTSHLRPSAVFVFTLALSMIATVLCGCKKDEVACVSEKMTMEGLQPRTCIVYSPRKFAPRNGGCFEGEKRRDACPDGPTRICVQKPSTAKEPWDGKEWHEKWYYYYEKPACDEEYLEVSE